MLYRCRQNTIEIGKRLIAAKELVGHGEFGKWLEDNFNMTVRTAQRFMKCAENFRNTTSMSHLKPSQMFEMLVLPEGEVEKFIAEKTAKGTPVEDMTVKQLRAEVAEYKAKLKLFADVSKFNQKKISQHTQKKIEMAIDCHFEIFAFEMQKKFYMRCDRFFDTQIKMQGFRIVSDTPK